MYSALCVSASICWNGRTLEGHIVFVHDIRRSLILNKTAPFFLELKQGFIINGWGNGNPWTLLRMLLLSLSIHVLIL